jgi:hypothetical protein
MMSTAQFSQLFMQDITVSYVKGSPRQYFVEIAIWNIVLEYGYGKT